MNGALGLRMNKYIPGKTIYIRTSDKPWFNSIIRKHIRIRDRLRKIYRKSNKLADLMKYRQQRNKVNNMIKVLKEEYICNLNDTLTEYHYNDQKSYWKIVRTLIKGTKPSYSIPSLFQNDTVAFTSEDKCDLLNNYFCSVTDLDNRDKDLPRFDDRTDATMTNVVVTEQDILDIIEVIDPKKASGPDDFSHILLKKLKMEIIKPLLTIFNKSLELGQFPKQWKHAHVIPIFKKGDNFRPENYRPVSLLSCIGKVFERVVFKYIYNHLHAYDLLYDLQAGFRPGHSTVTQLIEIYHNVCLALENKELSCFTFCDISKAFDRVWIKGLIFKLEKYGFQGQILSWLSDYLHNRTQQVKIEQSVSTVGKLWAGVPQGSVLGPLFIFDLY